MSAEYFYDWLRLLLDVSVKAILLCALAGLALWVLRVRNDNVQHRVWTAVLAGMLLMPLLVNVTPSVPLPSWLYPELPPLAATPPAADEGSPSPSDGLSDGSSAPVGERTRSDSEDPRVAEISPQAWQEDPMDIGESEAMADVSERAGALSSRQGILIARDAGSLPSAGSWPLVVLAIYAAGFLAFFFRLLIGIGKARRFLGRGRPLSLARGQLPGRTAVLETPAVRIPMVAGWFRPCVLLPPDWPGWSEPMLAAVLSHEQAHIARRDHWVALLAEVNRCIHWFHPVAWCLRSKLLMLAERNCDDAVIEFTGDRTSYARQLVSLAGQLGNKPSWLDPVGVAMARRSNVETRIDSILDTKRPLARRIGVAGTLILLAVMVPTVLVSAALRPADNQGASSSETAAGGEEASPKERGDRKSGDERASNPTTAQPSSVADKKTGDRLVSASGRVVDTDGKPVRGATVYLRQWALYQHDLRNNSTPDDVLGTAKTDELGQFYFPRVPVPPSKRRHSYSKPSPEMVDLVVMAEGYAMGWKHVRVPSGITGLQLTLLPEDKLTGRLVDEKGQSIAGAEVKAIMLGTLGDDLGKEPGTPGWLNLMYSRIAPTVHSGTDGRFTIDKLPSGVRVTLRVNHPRYCLQKELGFLNDYIYADTTDEPQPTITTKWRSSYDNVTRTSRIKTHARDFTVTMYPAVQLTGRVIFADTQKPYSNANLMLCAQGCGWLERTDADGRFAFRGLPFMPQYFLSVTAPKSTDYLSTSISVKFSEDQMTVDREIRVPKGETITGLVVGEDTGRGVPKVRVNYVPEFFFVDQGVTDKGPSFSVASAKEDPAIYYRAPGGVTDENGYFRLVAPPGSGTLTIKGPVDNYDVPQRQAWNNSMRYYPDFDKNRFTKTIDVKPGQSADEIQFTVGRGVVIEGEVTDADGKPVAGAEVKCPPTPDSLLPKQRKTQTDAEGRFTLSGFPVAGELHVLINHDQRKLKAIAVVPAGEPDVSTRVVPLKVQLLPVATIRGVVLEDGKPVSSRSAILRIDQREHSVADKDARAKTDAQGRFEFPLVAPSTAYRVYVRTDVSGFDAVSNPVTPGPGEVIELPPLEIPRFEKSVSGIVVDPDGNPLNDVHIRVRLRDQLSHLRGYRNYGRGTEEDGRFKISRLPDVPLIVSARRNVGMVPGSRYKDRRQITGEVEAQPGRQDIRVVLDPRNEHDEPKPLHSLPAVPDTGSP